MDLTFLVLFLISFFFVKRQSQDAIYTTSTFFFWFWKYVVLLWFLCSGHEVANRRQISNLDDNHASVEILKKRHRR